MSGKIADRENRNKRARRRVVEMVAKRMKDKTLIFYHELIVRTIAQYSYVYTAGKRFDE